MSGSCRDLKHLNVTLVEMQGDKAKWEEEAVKGRQCEEGLALDGASEAQCLTGSAH